MAIEATAACLTDNENLALESRHVPEAVRHHSPVRDTVSRCQLYFSLPDLTLDPPGKAIDEFLAPMEA